VVCTQPGGPDAFNVFDELCSSFQPCFYVCVVLSLLNESHPPSPVAGLLHRSISESEELKAIMMKNVLGMMV